MANMSDFHAYMKRFNLEEKELKFFVVWIEKYGKFCKRAGLDVWESQSLLKFSRSLVKNTMNGR